MLGKVGIHRAVSLLLTMVLTCGLCFGLAGCGDKIPKSMDVVILKQTDSTSIDAVAAAITAGLDRIAAEQELKVTYQVVSGGNDSAALQKLAEQAIKDKTDAIIPIATMAAQVAASAAAESQTPVIYVGVSDPAAAGLSGANITGISDAPDMEFLVEMMLAQNSSLGKVGLLYSTTEAHSQKEIAEAKAALQSKGIAVEEQTGDTAEALTKGATALASAGVEAVLTPADAVVLSVQPTVGGTLLQMGIPQYAAAETFVKKGAYACCYADASSMGEQAAELIYQVLIGQKKAAADESAEPVTIAGSYSANITGIAVNEDTQAGLGLDSSAMSGLAPVKTIPTEE